MSSVLRNIKYNFIILTFIASSVSRTTGIVSVSARISEYSYRIRQNALLSVNHRASNKELSCKYKATFAPRRMHIC